MLSSTNFNLLALGLTSHIFKSILRFILCLQCIYKQKRIEEHMFNMQRVYPKYYREPPTAGPMALNIDTTVIDTPFATPLSSCGCQTYMQSVNPQCSNVVYTFLDAQHNIVLGLCVLEKGHTTELFNNINEALRIIIYIPNYKQGVRTVQAASSNSTNNGHCLKPLRTLLMSICEVIIHI
jgi:hypothetical protein